jgi:hypothetical protein
MNCKASEAKRRFVPIPGIVLLDESVGLMSHSKLQRLSMSLLQNKHPEVHQSNSQDLSGAVQRGAG